MEGLQIPAKNNLIKIQLWWTGQHTASSVKLPTYRFVIYCINTCFIFMNIKPKGIAFWLLQKLCLTKETDLIPYFSHRVFWISMVLFCLVIIFFCVCVCDFFFFPFFFLPKSSDLVFCELFQGTHVCVRWREKQLQKFNSE